MTYSERDAVVLCMIATYFELTSLARVKFPPHNPVMLRSMSCMMYSYDLFH